MIIAVDGPAASGKGTLAAGLARHYGLPHLDTGLLYRAVGRAVEAHENSPDFEARAIVAAESLDFTDIEPEFLLSQRVGSLASKVAVIGPVRKALFRVQREFALRPGGAVLDGRDTGTQIVPEADIKLFIVAEPEARAERRARQFEARGQKVDRAALKAGIEERDARDRNNPFGGFYPAPDAHQLDTTKLDIDAALKAAIRIIDETMASRTGSQAVR